MAEMTPPDSAVALIVPVRDDTAALATLLARISNWPQRPGELIVVSATLDAALRALCRDHGVRLLECEGTRGRRLERGVAASRSPVLWFLHADADPPPNGLAAIAATIANGGEGGCFRFRFQGERRWYKIALEALIALRLRAGGMAYGDQGLFVTRKAYQRAGGFSDVPLFEEVALVRALRATRSFRALDLPVGVSPRRWERDGWIARTLANRWLALCHACGVPADRLARAYRRSAGTTREVPR
jgi:rSAM/selenodomain-associated transferase 2